MIYCTGLGNVVMSELLGQYTNTDPFPSYFVSEHACVHFVLNNQTQLLRIQIGQDRIVETNAHILHTKISQRIQAFRLQNTQ
jgi:hypothetical protein